MVGAWRTSTPKQRRHMESYQGGRPLRLSGRPRRMILGKSGISSEVTAERGCTTMWGRAERVDSKECSRQAGLVVPIHSLVGRTQSAQLRPDRPRKGSKGKLLKHEASGCSKVVLDVQPRMWERVADGSEADEDHWVTEVIRKAGCLTSWGLPTVGLTGVRNRQRAVQAVIRILFARNPTPRRSSGNVHLPSRYRGPGTKSSPIPHPI